MDETMQSSPVCPGKGPNFATFELLECGWSVLEFQPTKAAKMFSVTFKGLGGVVALVGMAVGVMSQNPLAYIGVPAGLLLFILGHRQSITAHAVRRFDGIRREVTIPSEPEDHRSPQRTIPFDQIDRLQVVEKTLDGGEDRDYACFELVLALKEGARLLVVHHSDKPRIVRDGERIASLIGCRLEQCLPSGSQ